jgi:hypothetical protein
MADEIVRAVNTGKPIYNGSIVVSIGERGRLDEFGLPASGHKVHPEVNSFVPSGTLYTRLTNRFDEHYGGGAS